jgi:hypothetical protein
MATCTLGDVFGDARGYLHDTQVAGGESFTNAMLQVHFNEPYRTLFNNLMGVSKRVQRIAYVVLPAYTTILIPQNFGITDLAEPELVEERPATAAIAISATANSSPISVVTAAPHGLGPTNAIIAGQVSGVAGTTAPWGNWFVTITGANTFTLNGSRSDGGLGTGGNFYAASAQQFVTVMPQDLAPAMDGQPQQYLGTYEWINEQLQFRGSTQNQQLRLTYWASGDPPTNANTNINIDNCRDFLAVATAANAANSVGWYQMSDRLNVKAYNRSAGPQGDNDGGLLAKFIGIQVMTMQRGPQRRQLPFRARRDKFGNFLIG